MSLSREFSSTTCFKTVTIQLCIIVSSENTTFERNHVTSQSQHGMLVEAIGNTVQKAALLPKVLLREGYEVG